MRKIHRKNNILRAILTFSAILSLCLFGGLIYRINAFGDMGYQIPDECNIGGNIYTSEHPMKILEIVPDYADDELGIMIGNDQGIDTWNDVQKECLELKENAKKTQLINNYLNRFNNQTPNSLDYSLVLLGEDGSVTQWCNDDVCADPSFYRPVMAQIVNNQIKQIKNEDTDIRNYFSIEIFQNYDMEDKIDLTVKLAADVKKSDIDQANLVYLNGKSHYNASSVRWGENGQDLSAETAFYLYQKYTQNEVALIFQSIDKEGTFKTNIQRIITIICGIDRDKFVADFCCNGTDSGGYTGEKGKVQFKNDLIHLYYNNSDYEFSLNMFIDDSNPYVKEELKKNNLSDYPSYNSGMAVHFLYKNAFEFNSDNSMTSTMLDLSYDCSDYDGEHYKGTTFEEAYVKVGKQEDNKISSALAIRYILGDYGNDTTIGTLKVLEIEPAGQYQYNVDQSKEGKETRSMILSWFGIKNDVDVDVSVDHIAMNGFIGMNCDIRSEYDLIILGSETDHVFNTSISNHTYNTGHNSIGSSLLADAEFRKNDLTQKAYDKLYQYISIGMPFMMDWDVFYGNSDIVDSDTYVSELQMPNLKAMLLDDSKSFDNISVVPSEGVLGKRFEYQTKPDISLNQYPADYNGNRNNLIDSKDLSNIGFSGNVSDFGSNYNLKLYFDRNCDSIFSSDSTSENAELYFDQNSQAAGELTSNGNFHITVNLPEATTGYISWKMEVENLDNGLISQKTGAFGIKPSEEKKVKVLQIIKDPDTTTPPTINLEGEDFKECFDKMSPVTGLDLEVTVYTKTQFNWYISRNPKLLNYYSIVVMGMNDSYGNDDGLSDVANQAIYNYIEAGNSVLFSHDCMAYKTNNNVAGNEDNLNRFTKKFKTQIGVESGYCLTDSLAQKLTSKNIFQSVKPGGNTINTNTVDKLNQGQINSYPYQLDEESMNVATTHGQYFKLDLEEQADEKDVIVWYTLGSNGGTGDDRYFELTGQDALNNYYIYSKGNVTYTSAGHNTLDSNHPEELKLFVNTFIRAIMSGNSVPQVVFDDAAKETDNLYSLLIRDKITGNKDQLIFHYTITDADLVSKKGYLDQAFLFYDANENEEYDESEDVVIGYIDENGGIHPEKEKSEISRSAISGVTYQCDLITVLDQCVGGKDYATIMNKLMNNQLKIGIVAIDSEEATGYAVQKMIQRELFDLD